MPRSEILHNSAPWACGSCLAPVLPSAVATETPLAPPPRVELVETVRRGGNTRHRIAHLA